MAASRQVQKKSINCLENATNDGYNEFAIDFLACEKRNGKTEDNSQRCSQREIYLGPVTCMTHYQTTNLMSSSINTINVKPFDVFLSIFCTIWLLLLSDMAIAFTFITVFCLYHVCDRPCIFCLLDKFAPEPWFNGPL